MWEVISHNQRVVEMGRWSSKLCWMLFYTCLDPSFRTVLPCRQQMSAGYSKIWNTIGDTLGVHCRVSKLNAQNSNLRSVSWTLGLVYRGWETSTCTRTLQRPWAFLGVHKLLMCFWFPLPTEMPCLVSEMIWNVNLSVGLVIYGIHSVVQYIKMQARRQEQELAKPNISGGSSLILYLSLSFLCLSIHMIKQ